jgi:hypothetical protein
MICFDRLTRVTTSVQLEPTGDVLMPWMICAMVCVSLGRYLKSLNGGGQAAAKARRQRRRKKSMVRCLALRKVVQ